MPVTYFRAAVVLGGGSESFQTVYYLVRRLPAMVTPKWTTIRTQPIAITDVVSYLEAAADVGPWTGREVEIGGTDITTYGGMMGEMADAMGKRRPLMIRVPVLTPRLSSLWIGLVTPIPPMLARPLIESLVNDVIVTGNAAVDAMPIEHHRQLVLRTRERQPHAITPRQHGAARQLIQQSHQLRLVQPFDS